MTFDKGPYAMQINTIQISAVDTEYSLSLGTISNCHVQCRNRLSDLRIAVDTGHVAASTEPFIFVPYSSSQTLTFAPATSVTLYVAADHAPCVVEVLSH